MKKWGVKVTVTFTLEARKKKDAVRAALDRLECEGEEGYHIFAEESLSDDSPQEDRPNVLRQVEPAPDVLKQVEPAPDGQRASWAPPSGRPQS